MIPKEYGQVELKLKDSKISANSGLAWIDKALKFCGFWEDIEGLSKGKRSNNEIGADKKIRSEILSRISGAGAIEDIEVIRRDKGLERMTGEKIVSPDTIINFIRDKRTGVFLKEVNERLIMKALRASEIKEFTYDNDATYFESTKDSARYSYRETKDFSGLLGFITELNLSVTMDFRAGNISPREGILEQIKRTAQLCKGAKKKLKKIRLDSAGHNNDIFKFCNKEGIDYYITLVKNTAIKESIKQLPEDAWKKTDKKYGDGKDREYAEFIYATNDERVESMRAIVLRWINKEQLNLFEDKYSYHIAGTNNLEQSPVEILEIHAGRMGSENYNKELKEGYSIEWMPSHDFRANANYFYLGVIAYNCVEFVKRFFVGKEVASYRIKKFRHWFIKISGKLIKTGRRYIFQIINATDNTFEMFKNIRRRMQYAW